MQRAADRPGRPRRLLLVVLTAVATVAGGLTLPTAASAAVGEPVTYLGHPYSSSVVRPSEDKPQSKLWHHDGSWWALMVESGGSLVHIHELMPDHTWRNTGTRVDDRVNSTGDAMWSTRDDRLYVASRTSGSDLQVNAFTYALATRTWSVAPGFPVTVSSGGGSESTTVDQDSTGRLWVTYTRASRVWVAHSTDASRTTWTAGFQPSVPDTVIKADDISALIAFGNSIGLLWSDQESGAMRFAVHRDGDPTDVWHPETVRSGPGTADDHMNLKQLVGDPQGRIFAAVKTSADEVAGASPEDTLVGVLTRTPLADGTGAWTMERVATVAQGWTRPMLMVDRDNKELYVFATTGVGGPDIHYKKTSLSQVDFSGAGRPFVDATPSVNSASGAKDPVTAATGLVVLATAEGQKRYAHAEMSLAGGTTGGDTVAPTATGSPAPGAAGVAVGTDVTARFSEPVVGVSGSTFTLRPTGGSTAVAADVTYDGTARTATLAPTGDLAAGTQYTATLTGGITDASGNPLSPDPTTWTFTTAAAGTGDGTAPTVRARTPAPGATGVGLSVNVTATFSEAVDGVGTSSFTLTTPTGATVPAVVSRSSTTNKWVLNPDVTLARDTRYTVTLTGGPGAIRDLSGVPLATESWEFLTGPAPKVNSRSPGVNATGVSRTADVRVTFSEAVENVGDATFALRNSATGAAVAAVVSRSGTTNTWVLDPDATLAAGTRYTVTLTGRTGGIRDVAGNWMTNHVTWSFTTGA